MSFGGPIDSMVNANKQNLKQLGKRRKLKDIQSEYKASAGKPIKIRESGVEEMNRFKEKLEKDKKRDHFQFILIVGLTLVIMLILMFWVMTADFSGVIDLMD